MGGALVGFVFWSWPAAWEGKLQCYYYCSSAQKIAVSVGFGITVDSVGGRAVCLSVCLASGAGVERACRVRTAALQLLLLLRYGYGSHRR
jgi:hypothetical protein